jgi:hypothetical protein
VPLRPAVCSLSSVTAPAGARVQPVRAALDNRRRDQRTQQAQQDDDGEGIGESELGCGPWCRGDDRFIGTRAQGEPGHSVRLCGLAGRLGFQGANGSINGVFDI